MARKENSVNAVRSDIRRRSNPEIPSRPPPPSENYSGGMRDEREARLKTMEVELVRDYQGYGFSIRGGRELNLPIFVLRMAEGGVAERDGRLRVSEEVQNIWISQSYIYVYALLSLFLRSLANIRAVFFSVAHAPLGGRRDFRNQWKKYRKHSTR